jgi:hypothetical protein
LKDLKPNMYACHCEGTQRCDICRYQIGIFGEELGAVVTALRNKFPRTSVAGDTFTVEGKFVFELVRHTTVERSITHVTTDPVLEIRENALDESEETTPESDLEVIFLDETKPDVEVLPESPTPIVVEDENKAEEEIVIPVDIHRHDKPTSACLICYEDTKDDKCTTPCDCAFVSHYQCLAQWIELKHRCPLCRRSIRSVSLIHNLTRRSDTSESIGTPPIGFTLGHTPSPRPTRRRRVAPRRPIRCGAIKDNGRTCTSTFTKMECLLKHLEDRHNKDSQRSIIPWHDIRAPYRSIPFTDGYFRCHDDQNVCVFGNWGNNLDYDTPATQKLIYDHLMAHHKRSFDHHCVTFNV